MLTIIVGLGATPSGVAFVLLGFFSRFNQSRSCLDERFSDTINNALLRECMSFMSDEFITSVLAPFLGEVACAEMHLTNLILNLGYFTGHEEFRFPVDGKESEPCDGSIVSEQITFERLTRRRRPKSHCK